MHRLYHSIAYEVIFLLSKFYVLYEDFKLFLEYSTVYLPAAWCAFFQIWCDFRISPLPKDVDEMYRQHC